ncbi:MAG: OsmC family protein [Saprospiraceae bacterium]|tara:strand:+ start:767 stop:1156 length:390 start_codon:yes stop_codon:yes gene_type:complete
MKVTLTSDDLKTFHGSNVKEQTITLGNGNAVGPMEGVLLSAAGCSTIDIVMILEKMRQPIESIEVQVEGTRQDAIPRIFTHMHLHYILKGNLKDKKVKEAVDLSIDKYCSVVIMLAKVIEISTSYEISE